MMTSVSIFFLGFPDNQQENTRKQNKKHTKTKSTQKQNEKHTKNKAEKDTPMEAFVNALPCPVLDIGKQRNDYIDFITWDMLRAPVMKGHDVYGRPFLVVLLTWRQCTFINTFFKRYSDANDWVIVSTGYRARFFGTGYMKPDCLDLLMTLLIKGEARLSGTKNYNICVDYMEDDIVCISKITLFPRLNIFPFVFLAICCCILFLFIWYKIR